MTLMQKLLSGATLLAMSATAALAEPALMYDMGGKFDKSFNEAAYNGAKRWAEETGGTYREIEVTAEAQRVQFATRLAEAGFNPIVELSKWSWVVRNHLLHHQPTISLKWAFSCQEFV